MSYEAFFGQAHPRLGGRVDFVGFVDKARLQALYRDCDIFVAPSLYESFGLIFLEAMNYARPVIGCDAGGPAEIIVHGETGLLIPPSDPRSLALAISRLLASRRTARHRASRAPPTAGTVLAHGNGRRVRGFLPACSEGTTMIRRESRWSMV